SYRAVVKPNDFIRNSIKKHTRFEAMLEFAPVSSELHTTHDVLKRMKLLGEAAVGSEEVSDHGHLGLLHESEDRTAKVIKSELKPLHQHVPEATWTVGCDCNQTEPLRCYLKGTDVIRHYNSFAAPERL